MFSKDESIASCLADNLQYSYFLKKEKKVMGQLKVGCIGIEAAFQI